MLYNIQNTKTHWTQERNMELARTCLSLNQLFVLIAGELLNSPKNTFNNHAMTVAVVTYVT